MNPHVINLFTGRPVDENHLYPWSGLVDKNINKIECKTMEYPPSPLSLEEAHERMCQSVGSMMQCNVSSLNCITNLATTNAALAKSIRWKDEDGVPITVPMVLRAIRRELEWLEGFYNRGDKK